VHPPVTHDSIRLWRLLWVAAILFVVYASTLPFAFVSDAGTVHAHWVEAIQRSASSGSADLSKADVLQNVLLFVPLGFLGVASVARTRRFGALLIAVGAAAGLSAASEVLQLFTVDRLTSLWDLWANVAGAALGGVVYFVVEPVSARVWNGLPESTLERQRAIPVWGAAVVVVLSACEPFDITLDVGTVWAKVKPFVVNGPSAWQPLNDELLTLVRFGMLSFLLAEWMRGPNTRAWGVRTLSALACVLLAVGLEVTQFLIASRSPSMQDLIAAISGVAMAWLFVPMLMRVLPAPALIIAAITAAAVPFYLQPFAVSPTYGSIATMPFLAYYQFTSLQTVSHVVDLMLIYAPMAFAIVWMRPDGLRFALLLVVVTAGTLEYAQGWIVGRFPDVTDVGMAVLGGLAGAKAAIAARRN
jgi:glycopeptide antibiotics resistance protein